MKPVDFTSVAVASVIGGFLLTVIVFAFYTLTKREDFPSLPLTFAAGSVVGAGVQVSVRLTGVS